MNDLALSEIIVEGAPNLVTIPSRNSMTKDFVASFISVASIHLVK